MNPTTTTRRLLLCAAVAALGACGSTPAAHFYALNPSAAQSTTGASEVALLVGPISVAQYLDRPQLARRVSAQELVFDEFHRWAEPIDQALSRTLALDLAALLGSTQVLQFPARGQRPFEFRLEVLVTRFEQDSAGRAVFEARWTLIPAEAPEQSATRLFRSEKPLTRPGDPAALAAALDQAAAEFAREVAGLLRAGG